MDDNSSEFVCYKKVLVFGAESTGKTTLTNQLKNGKFSEEKSTIDGNYIFFNKIF